MKDYLSEIVSDLLHVDEGATNKLVDLEANDVAKTYYLKNDAQTNLGCYTLDLIRERIGKPGNTLLRGSTINNNVEKEQRIGNVNIFDWVSANGDKDPNQLEKFVATIYKELSSKGNNPLFISVGALKWRVSISKDEIKDVLSPILIFPVRLIRAAKTNPLAIEFVNDDAYFNPCLIYRMRRDLVNDVSKNLPHPNGENGDFDEPLDLDNIDASNYFNELKTFIDSCKNDENTVFEFDPNVVAISHYNHNELCMYYDIKRNKEKILNHDLVKKMFRQDFTKQEIVNKVTPRFVLPVDKVQEEMIKSAVNGSSMIIKGPPGTGKTLTIANMIVSLIDQGKRVLVSSKKLAALSEVYAKVPEKLRKFLLLLDSESEAQAAAINPSAIKKDLNSILTYKKHFSFSDNIRIDTDSAERIRYGAISELSEHIKDTFRENNIFGNNYYEAIDIFCKDANIPVFEFDRKISLLPREMYNHLVSLISEASDYYNELSDNGRHYVYKCPWYGISENHNTDKIYDEYQEFIKLMNDIKLPLERFYNGYSEDFNDLSIATIHNLIKGDLSLNQIEILLNSSDERDLRKFLKEFLLCNGREQNIGKIDNIKEKALEACIKLDNFKLDNNLSNKELDIIVKNIKMFDNDNSNFLNPTHLEKLWSIAEAWNSLLAQIEKYEFNAWSVFKKDMSNEDRNFVISSYDSLANYLDKDVDKPSLLDFKSKKALVKLNELCYLNNVSFKEIVNGVNELHKAYVTENEIGKLFDNVQRIFQCSLKRTEVECLFLVMKKSKEAELDLKTYVRRIYVAYEEYFELARAIFKDEETYLVKDVKDIYTLAHNYEVLRRNIIAFNKDDVSFDVDKPEKLESLTKAIIAIFAMKKIDQFSTKNGEFYQSFINGLRKVDEEFKICDIISTLKDKLYTFGVNEFLNYYSEKPSHLTMNDFNIFINEANKRQLIGFALKYYGLKHTKENNKNPIIAPFFEKFEKGDLDSKGYSFVDIFEHSAYYAGIKEHISKMGNRRFDVANNIQRNFDNFYTAEEKIRENNVMLIENKLLSEINVNDELFRFLALEKDDRTLRKLFKDNPEAILKLKRCVILSPSTVSLLFRPEEYEQFDVAIIDEASQLEPVTILPVLFRAKQCVVVGDEWQMPPMNHFKIKNEVLNADPDADLQPEASALTMMLDCKLFDQHELQCHYRSKTESLITFSQKSFYPKMKTFPAPVPKKENLGFRDIYVEGATCDDGVNIKEAKEVVEQVKRHFDTYFINDKLIESVGVVAFGEKQLKKINSLVEADLELSKKIALARQNKDKNVVDEKVIFFKTIEKVQGQEANHLILSLTYGVDKSGNPVNRFGELNRGKLGKCIFNVAVTRAQYSITVIHSVLARNISFKSDESAKNIGYIKEYLNISESFSEEGKGQFVSVKPHQGFIKQIGDYLISLGIDEERIVYDYGVTDGSIRIPLVILSQDKKSAVYGLFCEKDVKANYDFIDYNIRYYRILEDQCYWKLQRIFIHDWFDNQESVKTTLKGIVKDIVNL